MNLFKTIGITLLFMPVVCVLALPEDRQKPITGQADQTEIDTESGQTLLTGSVVVRQGLLSIHASRMLIKRDAQSGEINYIFAEGSPAYLIDAPNTPEEIVEVYGQSMEFLPLENRIITVGEAEIKMEGNIAKGERIEYNTLNGQMLINSEKSLDTNQQGKQAEFILQPQTSNSATDNANR